MIQKIENISAHIRFIALAIFIVTTIVFSICYVCSISQEKTPPVVIGWYADDLDPPFFPDENPPA